MAVSDIIRLGDKIDIRLAENLEKNSSSAKVYRSQVMDVKENGRLEIAMPSEKGELILLPLGVRFEFTFYSNGSIYKSIGQVTERYRKDGFFMLQIRLNTALQKFQRREFYRYNCTLDFEFYLLNEEQMQMETADEVYRNLTDEDIKTEPIQAMMIDLSGGGMKFRSLVEVKPGNKILVSLPLKFGNIERHFHILSNIIACRELNTAGKVLYEGRVNFDIEDNRTQEAIIRYIFEEERRIRRKENG